MKLVVRALSLLAILLGTATTTTALAMTSADHVSTVSRVDFNPFAPAEAGRAQLSDSWEWSASASEPDRAPPVYDVPDTPRVGLHEDAVVDIGSGQLSGDRVWSASLSVEVRGPSTTHHSRSVATNTADDLARSSGILRDAARGKGNFGLGSASAVQADDLGLAWVGPNYRVASDGKTLISADGLRQYRPPSYKPNLGRTQANFETRYQPEGAWQANGHLDITP